MPEDQFFAHLHAVKNRAYKLAKDDLRRNSLLQKAGELSRQRQALNGTTGAARNGMRKARKASAQATPGPSSSTASPPAPSFHDHNLINLSPIESSSGKAGKRGRKVDYPPEQWVSEHLCFSLRAARKVVLKQSSQADVSIDDLERYWQAVKKRASRARKAEHHQEARKEDTLASRIRAYITVRRQQEVSDGSQHR